jgi:hypothetical protein
VVGRWCWMRFDFLLCFFLFSFVPLLSLPFLFLVFDEMGLSYVEDWRRWW